MAFISPSTIKEIENTLDAVAVVGDYIHLEKRGGRYWGRCPFHSGGQEKTPSFKVDPDRKIYYCFGCGQSGGIIKFVMEMDKLSFPDAVETLAKRFGIEIVYENSGPFQKDEGKSARLEQLAELYQRVAGSFSFLLMEKSDGHEAKQYIISRGISQEMIERFRLGYAPADRGWLFRFLSGKGYSEEFLASSGLFSKNNPRSAFFGDRLMFPIADRQSKTVAFGGRILSGEGPKYLNSAESEVYKKRETLYAIDLALPEIRRTKEVYLAEGYMDVIALHQAGLTNALAPLGTAFTDEQARLLRRWAERIYLIMDTDEAGQNATVKDILTCRKNGLDCFVVVWEAAGLGGSDGKVPAAEEKAEFKDPADILKKFGQETLKKNVKCFITGFEYLIQRSRSLFDFADSAGKSKAAAFLFPYLKTLDSEVARDTCAGIIADSLGVDRQAILADFRQAESGQENRSRIYGVMDKAKTDAGERPISLNDELFLLTTVFVNGSLYTKLRSSLSIEDLSDPYARELWIALEEWFRNDMPGMDDLALRVNNERLRNFVHQQLVSEAFSHNPEQLVADGIRKIKQKRLERRLAGIVIELRIAKNEKSRDGAFRNRRLEDLLAEKVHLDAELRRLKEANE
jgi:DNA primase